MMIFQSKQKKFEGNLKKNYAIKDYIPQQMPNTWESKLKQIFAGNVNLMISLLR